MTGKHYDLDRARKKPLRPQVPVAEVAEVVFVRRRCDLDEGIRVVWTMVADCATPPMR